MSESVTAATVSIVIPAYSAATSSGQALIPRAAFERAASYVGFRREIGSAAAARRNARDCPPEARPVLEHKLASFVPPATTGSGGAGEPAYAASSVPRRHLQVARDERQAKVRARFPDAGFVDGKCVMFLHDRVLPPSLQSIVPTAIDPRRATR